MKSYHEESFPYKENFPRMTLLRKQDEMHFA